MLWMPPDKSARVFVWLNVVSFVTLVSMMIWALNAAHGAGPLLSQVSFFGLSNSSARFEAYKCSLMVLRRVRSWDGLL